MRIQPHLVPYYFPTLVRNDKSYSSLVNATINVLHKITPKKANGSLSYIEKSTEDPPPNDTIEKAKGEASKDINMLPKSAMIQIGGKKTSKKSGNFRSFLNEEKSDNSDSETTSDSENSESDSLYMSDSDSASLNSDQEQKLEEAKKRPIKVTETELHKLKNHKRSSQDSPESIVFQEPSNSANLSKGGKCTKKLKTYNYWLE